MGLFLSFSKSVIGWTVNKVQPFMRLRGAPDSTEDTRLYASSVLRIAHPQLVFLRCLDLGLEGERLMDVLRVTDSEISALSAENPALFSALTERKPPTDWIRNPSGQIPSVFIKAALRLEPKELEEITVTAAKIKPLDWLIDTALDNARFFPEPVDLRALFAKKLPCADGEEYAAPAVKKEN